VVPAPGIQAIPFARALFIHGKHYTLLALVNPGYLLPDSADSRDSDSQHAALFNYEGLALYGDANGQFLPGHLYPDLPMFDVLRADQNAGLFRMPMRQSPGDNLERASGNVIVNFRAGRNLPFVAAISISETAIVEQWQANTLYNRWTGYAGAILVLLYSLFLYRSAWLQDRARQQLSAAEERWGFALEGNGDGVWDRDLQQNTMRLSARARAILGVEQQPAELGFLEWQTRIHPAERHATLRLQQEHLAGRSAAYSSEMRLQRPDGSYLWVLDRGKVVSRDADGRPLRMIGTFTDISDRHARDAELRAAQEELQDSEARFRKVAEDLDILISAAPLGIGFTNDGTLLKSNHAFAHFAGYETAEEMIGLPTVALFADAEDYKNFRQAINPSFDAIQTIELEWTLYRRNAGIRVPFRARIVGSALPRKNYSRGAVWIVEDVTERHRMFEALTNSEFRLRRLMNSSLVGIVQGDMNGSITEANEVFLALTGYTRAQLLGGGLTWTSLIPAEAHAGFQRNLEDLSKGGATQPAEKELIRNDGIHLPVLMGLAKLEGSDHEWVGFALDLSEQRRVDRIKSEFISVVSHELRTPLTSIRGSLGLLESGIGGALPPQALQLIRIAHKNSQRLVTLVNDILDMDRLLSGKMQLKLQEVDLQKLAAQAVDANAGMAAEFGVVIVLDPADENVNYRAIGDPDRLMQVLANLLSNAARFSGGLSEVNIRVQSTVGQVRVEVEDHGNGIPAAFQPRIFEAFAQADSSTTRQQGGTGLGLHISRTLIRQMGGHIGFHSQEQHGCVFWFTLPAA
jgi:PAS domain S-box-containing protein